VNRFIRAYLLLRELGPAQLTHYALYRAQLRSGALEKWVLPACPELSDPQAALSRAFVFAPAGSADPGRTTEIVAAANEIVTGIYHPFSGTAAPLDLSLPLSRLQHWTHYGDQLDGRDIKTIWEPARFSWVFPLCQAYVTAPDEKYPRAFWQHFETFLQSNPPLQGPNWASAQELALRLVPWLLAAQTFAASPQTTPQRLSALVQAVWQHTARIGQTLAYSRAQNNNHRLSEAIGLMLGGLVFSETTPGQYWLRLGAREFGSAVLDQVTVDGTYSQHSTNYHRLLLHLALLYKILSSKAHLPFSAKAEQRLAAATRWLTGQMDMANGYLPNLGHNDGSNLLPLGSADYRDYRPTAQAAGRAFLGAPCLPAGPWDELSLWLGLPTASTAILTAAQLRSPAVHRLGDERTWATLRSTQFHSRPAHADMLHVDLWHNGLNLLADAGTYAYNLPDPWQNALSGSLVHNTLTVAGQDQMIRDNKFLWLKRTGAFTLPSEPDRISAILYCDLPTAYTQVRTLAWVPGKAFGILDQIELARLEKTAKTVTIQFLLPDGEWQVKENTLILKLQEEQFTLTIRGIDPADRSAVPGQCSLVRAGAALVGSEANPIRGWISSTYLEKSPALSFAVTFETTKSLEIKSELIL